MPLESGQYYITSADGGSPIGRKPMEDPNRVPKGIYKLPEGTQSVVSTVLASLARPEHRPSY